MIKLSNVTKIFDHRGIAGIHDLSLEINRGSIVALMGPNGSGKTTLLNLISNKIPTDKGSLSVEGVIHFFDKPTFEPSLNVQRFLMEAVTIDVDTDKKIQLSRDLASIFEFTFQLRQNMGELSQGQLQKVLMAHELINQPSILFLDEPFIHLDPMTRKDILESLFTYLRQKEITVVWITHEIDEALRFSDKIALLHCGKLEQFSTPIEMISSPKNLYVAQYMGHKNFIKINKVNNEWSTPWGVIQSSCPGDEGYLVIPLSSWMIEKSSSFVAKILKTYPKFYSAEVVLEREMKVFEASFPVGNLSELKEDEDLPLKANLAHCFVIPL